MSSPTAGEREVSYWVGREYWGRGVAKAALRSSLTGVVERPLFARAARDNSGSSRVLERGRFVMTGEGTGFAGARGMEFAEVVLTLW